MRILFIDNYDSFTFNVLELLRQFQKVEVRLIKNDELGEIEINDYDKVIISPGPDLPRSSGALLSFLDRHITKLPVLGICLGHQAIAEHFGGRLLQYDNPKHGEKYILNVKEQEGLFKFLPSKFEVGLYHSWYVDNNYLPECLMVTAYTNDGIIMAMRHKFLPIHSVQFHPESYMSQYGREILQNFIQNA